MRNLPSDFIAAINADDAPVSMLVLKLESGDIKFSDGMYGEGFPYIENISEEQDGGSFENYLSRGNLETCKLSVTLIYSDLSRSTIHSVVSELQSMSADNLRCRAELWKKFVDVEGNATCSPLLWNVYAVQDNSENFSCREDQMLMPLELITLPGSENQKLSITNDPDKSYDYVIGKAEGLLLQFMEKESSKWTELLGDENGNEVSETYTGLIRVKDASKLRSGAHLINGEYVLLGSASAGYKKLISRGVNGSEPQVHGNGSRIFPNNAHFYYAVCLPVGGFDKLRTSNEIDVYDEDGDGNTTEYIGLYEADNVHYLPASNPAQIRFDDRMPYLMSSQELDIADKVFYGVFSGASFGLNSLDINNPNGKAKIEIKFREFSAQSTLFGYTEPQDVLVPSTGGGSSLISQSDSLKDGRFSISRADGAWDLATAYTEFKANGTAAVGDIGWIMAPIDKPKSEEYHLYENAGVMTLRLGFSCNDALYNTMQVSLVISSVNRYGGETPVWTFNIGNTLSAGRQSPPGPVIVGGVHYQNWYRAILPFSDWMDRRIKMSMQVIGKASNSSWALFRVGYAMYYPPQPSDTVESEGERVITGYTEKTWYNLYGQWRYQIVQPSAYMSSTFGKDMSSRGTFVSAKAKIKGIIRNTGNKATGTLKIYDEAIEKHSTNISNSAAVDQEITLSAASWLELSSTTVKVQIDLASLAGEITEGSAGFDFDGGIQWLITYKSTTLDGLQVNYTDTLYVDAVSTRGANWTPARAVQYIAQDHTSWADKIDTVNFDARHAEFVAAGHYLNGKVSGSSGSQDAIRTVLREGLAGLNYPLGKITMYSYLADLAATVPVESLMSIVRPDRESFPNRGFMQSANEMRTNRIFFRWGKNLSTGEYDGNVIKSDGTLFLNDQVVTFDLVKSDIIGNSVANFLWNLWKSGYIIQDCEFPAIALAIEKHDLIESFSMADDDATRDFIALSCSQIHESAKAKRGLSAKIIMMKRG